MFLYNYTLFPTFNFVNAKSGKKVTRAENTTTFLRIFMH